MLGYLLFFESSRIIGITRTSVVTLVDPLLAALVAIVLLGQMLSTLEWAGFFVITGSLLVFERGKEPVQKA
jgi:DME family drug/metabolite transporter